LGIAAAAGAVIAAPYLSADAFGGRIRQALERELHRPVEIQAARFNLLRGPGVHAARRGDPRRSEGRESRSPTSRRSSRG
jgi:hypothetical protein